MAAKIASYDELWSLPRPDFVVTQAHIDQVRALRARLFERWHELPAGESMELEFNRQSASRPDARRRVKT